MSPFFCQSHAVLLLWLCNIVRSQGAQYLQACFFFSSGLFWLWGLLWFHVHFRLLFFSIFVKNVLWILTGVALNVYISLGNMGFLILLILLTHEHRIVFHLFVSSSVSFYNVQ